MSRSHRSVVVDKSPLHPSALRLKDVRPGMRIIRFSLAEGVLGEYLVVRASFLGWPGSDRPYYEGQEPFLVVTLRHSSGDESSHSVPDMGLIPYSHGAWNDWHFTIDAKKRGLLPAPDPSLMPDLDDTWVDDDTYWIDGSPYWLDDSVW